MPTSRSVNRWKAESLIHSTEKSVKEYGDKVSDEDGSAIDNAIVELKSALEGDDTDAIKEKTNSLAEASMKLGEAMYQAQQAESAEADAAADAADDMADADDVVDADFEEVKDEKSGDDQDQKSA